MSNYSDSQLQKDKNSSWYKVLEIISDKSKVLDIGCSSGNFGVELIKKKKCLVDGIELDKEDFNLAKTKLRNVYNLNVEIDDLGIINEKYDYIYFGDVIEHLVQPSKTLKRVKQLLKNDGRVVFSIPNMAFIAIRLELLMGEFEYTETGILDKTHLHFYTLKEVERTFSEADYTLDILDFVESGYSTDVIKWYLEKVGLVGSKKFFDFCKTPEASAFQFIGSAKVGGKTKVTKLKKFSPFNRQDEYYKQKFEEYNNIISSQKNQIDSLRHENIAVRRELNEITNSKKYKILSEIAKIKHKF